ncbi:crustacean hyperglycemic hormone-like [Macrobrachium rosenbergii]|uniref:crustacean hyperglycemic hormone-like n=1 Tax=Macrobrachium rosenbergii TaxID=79674 RepID=UPI0034D3C00D
MSGKALIYSAVAGIILVLCLGLGSCAPASSSSSSSSPSHLGHMANRKVVAKRSYGESCQGFQFSKVLYNKLDKVCDECTNLYRKPYIKGECRTDCFVNDVFEKCLDVLLFDADEYLYIRSAIADY